MIRHKLFILILAQIFLTAFNLSDLHSQSNSVIGLKVEFSAPMGPIENADKVYFIRIQQDTNIIKVDRIFQTNFQIDNQIYLTDVEPGKYAIVAIGKEKILPFYGLTELTTYFSKDLIKENTVTVDSNDFVYMGSFSITTNVMVSNKKSDDTQLHYFRLMTERKRVPCYMRQVFLDTWFYRAGHENLKINQTDKSDFYLNAIKHFQGLGQEEKIRTKMDKK